MSGCINDPNYLPDRLCRAASASSRPGCLFRSASSRPRSPRRARRAKKGANVALTAGIVCIVLAVLGIGYFLYSYFFSDLFSRTEEVAGAAACGDSTFENFDQSQYPDLTFEVTDWRASDAYESGYVIEQSVDAGTMVKVGSKIELTLSSGIETNNMQNLVNMPLENALDYLNSLSMTLYISVDYQESDVYTAGYIIRTIPERNEPLTDGQSVTLVV